MRMYIYNTGYNSFSGYIINFGIGRYLYITGFTNCRNFILVDNNSAVIDHFIAFHANNMRIFKGYFSIRHISFKFKVDVGSGSICGFITKGAVNISGIILRTERPHDFLTILAPVQISAGIAGKFC